MSQLSEAALDLILECEVGGGQTYYDRFLARPNWPGASSGVTIGIGYDLGYVSRVQFEFDWTALTDSARQRLSAVIGLKAESASEAVSSVRSLIIPWAVALDVFRARTVPLYIKRTLDTFPRAAALPPDAFGALVSLVFNRGSATDGARRREMRDIGKVLDNDQLTLDAQLSRIASLLRSMKRLWINTPYRGLVRRRELEARLVEECIHKPEPNGLWHIAECTSLVQSLITSVDKSRHDGGN